MASSLVLLIFIRRRAWRSNPARTLREAARRRPRNATDGKKKRWTAKTGTCGVAKEMRKIFNYFCKHPKVPANSAVKGGQPVIRPKKIVAVLT
jgi:hypothetical protein